MSFWNLSDGTDAAQGASKEYDAGGGNFAPLPEGSIVKAVADKAEWKRLDDGEGPEIIEISWSVLAPESVANRKIFQKLWVSDKDPRAKKPEQKRDKAVRMLMAIDANAAGKLAQAQSKPDDMALNSLCNRPMCIRLGVWEMTDNRTGDTMSGNWVQAVMDKSHPVNVPEDKTPPRPKAQGSYQSNNIGGGGGGTYGGGHSMHDGDEIPF